MERTLIKDIGACEGSEVMLSGWIHRIRDLGGVTFVILRDRTGRCQAVTNDAVELNQETVVRAYGKIAANDKAPGGYELVLDRFDILGAAAPELPFPVNGDPSKVGIELTLDQRMISLRNPQILSIFRLQAALVKYFGDYLRSLDFTEIKSSKMIGTGTEGGTSVFTVEYFDRKVFLAQSPQFYKQAMVSSGLERVFEIGHAYRAEKHETSRHINEYVSLDVEMGFIESELDIIELERGLLAYIFDQVNKYNKADMDAWGATCPTGDQVRNAPIITHDEAKQIIRDKLERRVFEISPEGERVLRQCADRPGPGDRDAPRSAPFVAHVSAALVADQTGNGGADRADRAEIQRSRLRIVGVEGDLNVEGFLDGEDHLGHAQTVDAQPFERHLRGQARRLTHGLQGQDFDDLALQAIVEGQETAVHPVIS